MLYPYVYTSALLMHNLVCLCSVHRRCRHHDSRDWCLWWHRNCCMCQGCISPAAGFVFRGPFDVVWNSVAQRSDSGRVRTFHVLYTHTRCHDQHFITAVSGSNACTIMPLGIPFCVSCTCRTDWHEVHPFPKFNKLFAVRLTSMQLCTRSRPT